VWFDRQVEDVLNVIEKERPEGIIVQFGGQTPLSIAKPLQEALEKNPIQAASGASAFCASVKCTIKEARGGARTA
jgi:hypothetical protein